MTFNQYNEYLEKQGDDHSRRMILALQRLEDEIAELASTAPLRDGQLFDLDWAVSARRDIRQSIDNTIMAEAQGIIGGYGDIQNELADAIKFTGVPDEVLQGLQSLSFQGFEEIANSYSQELSDQMYQYTLTNRTQADMTKALRGKINGVYQEANQDELDELVEIANFGTDEAKAQAIEKLHSVYGSDKLGNNLRRYASTYVRDSAQQFSAQATIAMANEAGVDKFEYYGNSINDTREHCRKHAGKVYTRDDIYKIWQGDWKGKSDGDPFIVRGGYNCRHQWLPIIEEVETDDPDEADEPVAQQAPTGDFVLGTATKSSIKKSLNKSLAEASKDYPEIDGRYMKRFRGVTDAKLGKASLPTSLTTEATNLVNQLVEETNALADKYGVRKLRGVQSVGRSKAVANMGDGILGISPKYYNDYALSASIDDDKLADMISNLESSIATNRLAIQAKRERIATLSGAERTDLIDELNKDINSNNKNIDRINSLRVVQRDNVVTEWKLGDNLSKLPFGADEFFKGGIERSRFVVYHEFGHQIHQQLFVNSSNYRMPPLERWLARNFSKIKAPSKYGMTNSQEWFAESFALYEMGRPDLVDKGLVEILDKLKAGKLTIGDLI